MLRTVFSRSLLCILILALLPVHSWAANTPNIILITLEATRADHIGFLGSKHASPNLDALSRHSIIFERAYSQAPLAVVSHATILSGTYPQTHHASELGAPLVATIPYLPDVLHARGYRTAAYVGSILLDPRNGFAPGFERGFDVYDAGFHTTHRGEDLSEERDQPVEHHADQVVARATKWLNQSAKRPFFLWINLDDARTSQDALYDRGIANNDAALGKLISALHIHRLDTDAIIIVTADHGESLGAHGEDTHGVFLYDETIHVPLLVKLPQNAMAGTRVKSRVSLVDVAPTVLELAGIPVPSQMEGQSLLRTAKSRIAQAIIDADRPSYARNDFPQQAFGWSALASWRAGKYLYIRAPQPELYDLSTDPAATHNLAKSAKATLDTMASQLKAFDSHFGSGAGKGGGITSSEMQKLASLGYVGLQKPTSSVDAAVTGTDPKDAIATANQTLAAQLALDAGKPEKAVAAFRQVLAKQPNSYLVQYGLGITLVRKQQYSEAIVYLHKAIELQPDSAWAHYAMGLSLFKTGDFKTSAIHLEIAAVRLPQFSELHVTLAHVYEHLGRKQDAIRERAKTLELERDWVPGAPASRACR